LDPNTWTLSTPLPRLLCANRQRTWHRRTERPYKDRCSINLRCSPLRRRVSDPAIPERHRNSALQQATGPRKIDIHTSRMIFRQTEVTGLDKEETGMGGETVSNCPSSTSTARHVGLSGQVSLQPWSSLLAADRTPTSYLKGPLSTLGTSSCVGPGSCDVSEKELGCERHGLNASRKTLQ